MKRYVFIVMNICNIGGSEQYVYNKIQYLENKGFRIYVFSGMRGKILISDLNKFQNLIIPSVMYSPNCFSKREITQTIDKMRKYIGYNFSENEKVIIESDGVDEAKWGELLASKYNCRHIIFNMQEVHDYSDAEIAFLRFKYGRKELAGISESSVSKMLKDPNIIVYPQNIINAYCSNVVDDVENNFLPFILPERFLTIGSIGRLEKPFVIPMLKELCVYFNIHQDKTYNLILIGGTSESKVISVIKSIIKKCTNVNLVITGILYPIPRELLNLVDLFISTSGSAGVSYYENRPTIKVHPVSGKPVGIMGYSFNVETDSMFNELSDVTIIDMINQIVEQKIFDSIKKNNYSKEYHELMSKEFDRQLNFLDDQLSYDYYKTVNISKKGIKYKIYGVLGKILGGSGLQRFLDFMRKVIK